MSSATTQFPPDSHVPLAHSAPQPETLASLPTPPRANPSGQGSCRTKTPSPSPGEAPPSTALDDLDMIRDGLSLVAQGAKPPNRGGRPIVLDDGDKGKLTILLATGLSLRQSAAFLGVACSTVSEAIAVDEQFRSDIADAR